MKADLTRNTFDPFKHFSRVLMQQGRVQLDADWNEQAAILLRYLQTLAADLIGEPGGPKGNVGFEINPAMPIAPTIPDDFRIGPGRYYVDGILCELEATPVPIIGPITSQDGRMQVQVATTLVDNVEFQKGQYVELFNKSKGPGSASLARITDDVDQLKRSLTLSPAPAPLPDNPMLRRITTYLTQLDYPVPTKRLLTEGLTYFVYLDVWERHITYVEDDTIREVALGGPDTATRAKVVWQVKVAADLTKCDSKLEAKFQHDNRGRLKAKAKEKSASMDPCIIPPDSKYRGAENQLYRVEIHTGSLQPDGSRAIPTFKWSRENGSVVLPIVSLATNNSTKTTDVTVETLGRDDRFGLTEGDWVEIQDDAYVLQNRAETLLQVQAIDRPSMTVTLSGVPDTEFNNGPHTHMLLRRWDHKAGDVAEGGLTLGDDHAALIVEHADDNWLNLEDGIQIQFQPPDPESDPQKGENAYRTGDYWLIPARTATGDIEWPRETSMMQDKPVDVPVALPPAGVQHHYAPLAVIIVGPSGSKIKECRKQIPPSAAPIP